MIDVPSFLQKIRSWKRIVLLAPSFPVDFSYPQIIIDLKKIWFSKIVELTYAAKLINIHYHELFQNNPKITQICSNCPTIVQYIKNKYPQYKKNLTSIASPMIIMSRVIKKEFWSETKTIFIGPCFAKKIEAQQTKEVDDVITFKELQEIISYVQKNNLSLLIDTKTEKIDFDSFYNDYTKIYPLTGAVAQTMHYKDILQTEQVIIDDGIKNIDKAIKAMEAKPDTNFLDLLACSGGCIGGPWIISKESTAIKTQKIIAYKDHMKHNQNNPHLGQFAYAEGLEIKNTFI